MFRFRVPAPLDRPRPIELIPAVAADGTSWDRLWRAEPDALAHWFDSAFPRIDLALRRLLSGDRSDREGLHAAALRAALELLLERHCRAWSASARQRVIPSEQQLATAIATSASVAATRVALRAWREFARNPKAQRGSASLPEQLTKLALRDAEVLLFVAVHDHHESALSTALGGSERRWARKLRRAQRQLQTDERLTRSLAQLHQCLVPLTASANVEALKRRLLESLRHQVATAPTRLRQQKLRRLGKRSAVTLFCAGLAAIGLELKLPQSSAALRIEPDAGSELVWSDAVTELRRLTRRDSIPARGKLAVLGERGARLVVDPELELELDGHTRVTIAPTSQRQRLALELEEGRLHCLVAPLARGAGFTLGEGAARGEEFPQRGELIVVATPLVLVATEARFGVSRSPNDRGQLCVQVETGTVELRAPGKSLWVSAGQTAGCGANAASPLVIAEPDAELE